MVISKSGILVLETDNGNRRVDTHIHLFHSRFMFQIHYIQIQQNVTVKYLANIFSHMYEKCMQK